MGTEREAIDATDEPADSSSLTADLVALGLEADDVVIVHSSMAALGWINGGPQAVVEALLAAVGSGGTIVMPTQSGHLSDPADWSEPPVPAAWHERIRAEMPVFDPHLTPTRSMGAVVECFRHLPGTRRSPHPTVSFAANGPQADRIVGDHPLTPGLGDRSPLGRLYDLDAKVLLLGVGHGNDTSLHLAEYRAVWPGKADTRVGVPMRIDGVRQWHVYDDLDLDESDFATIGDDFASSGGERRSSVGAGEGRLCRQRAIVDFAVAWIEAHRT